MTLIKQNYYHCYGRLILENEEIKINNPVARIFAKQNGYLSLQIINRQR